jgi:hypothetical protein
MLGAWYVVAGCAKAGFVEVEDLDLDLARI